MPLSLDSLYQPFNAFFANKFAANAAAPVKFRFAHLPRSLADSDFLVPGHAELGPSPALAQEIFSGIVDGVPMLDDDGKTVWIGPQAISELYGVEMLAAAQGCAPAAIVDPGDRQAAVDAFNAIKHDARTQWETILEPMSLLAAGASYRAASAMPAQWWDRNAIGVWTPQSFHIAAPPAAAGGTSGGTNLLRLRVADAQVETVLRSRLAEPVPAPAPAAGGALRRRPFLAAAVNPAIARAPISVAAPVRTPIGLVADRAALGGLVASSPAAAPADLRTRISALPFRQRVMVEDWVRQSAPTQPVGANGIDIGFDFCVVSITRPWLDDAFLHNSAWYVPGLAGGALSANDGHGLPALPISFVAVKNLSIRAAWTPEDVSNLVQSVQFGPFNFDSNVVNGAITHAGIQIVGWLLQDSAALPPNAAPGS